MPPRFPQPRRDSSSRISAYKAGALRWATELPSLFQLVLELCALRSESCALFLELTKPSLPAIWTCLNRLPPNALRVLHRHRVAKRPWKKVGQEDLRLSACARIISHELSRATMRAAVNRAEGRSRSKNHPEAMFWTTCISPPPPSVRAAAGHRPRGSVFEVSAGFPAAHDRSPATRPRRGHPPESARQET